MKKMDRLLIYTLLGAIFVIPSFSRAQMLALDSIQVNLEAKDLALREALQQLVSQTKVQLVYHDAIVAGVKTSAALKNVTLRQALEEILTPADLTYRMMDDGQIVIVWRGWMERRGPSGGAGFRPPPPGSPEFIETALQEINLSDLQKARIDSMQKAQREKVFELFRKRQSGEFDFESFRSAHHQLTEDMMQQMQGILTQEQYKEFKKEVEAHRRPRVGVPPFRPEGGPPHGRPPRRM